MTTLLIGLVVFFALIAAGFIQSWPFGAGLMVMVGAIVAVLVWALDGAGKSVQDLFEDEQ